MGQDKGSKAPPMSTRLDHALKSTKSLAPEKHVALLVQAGVIAPKNASKATEKLNKRR